MGFGRFFHYSHYLPWKNSKHLVKVDLERAQDSFNVLYILFVSLSDCCSDMKNMYVFLSVTRLLSCFTVHMPSRQTDQRESGRFMFISRRPEKFFFNVFNYFCIKKLNLAPKRWDNKTRKGQ